MNMKFKICESGSNEPMLGLKDLSLGHAAMLALVPVGSAGPHDLGVGESCLCRGMACSIPNAKPGKDNKNVFTVVRTE